MEQWNPQCPFADVLQLERMAALVQMLALLAGRTLALMRIVVSDHALEQARVLAIYAALVGDHGRSAQGTTTP